MRHGQRSAILDQDTGTRSSSRGGSSQVLSPSHVPGTVPSTVYTFLLFTITALSEEDSAIPPILLERKLSLREEFDGGSVTGKCGDRT